MIYVQCITVSVMLKYSVLTVSRALLIDRTLIL
jgi:hypothetical protein